MHKNQLVTAPFTWVLLGVSMGLLGGCGGIEINPAPPEIVESCSEEVWIPDDNPFKEKHFKRKCSTDLRKLVGNYVAAKDGIYWMTRGTSDYHPCGKYSLYTLKPLYSSCDIQRRTEVSMHRLDAIASNELKKVHVNSENMVGWKKSLAEDYATDGQSVFLRFQKIKGADPASFTVIFPFGDELEFSMYPMAKDKRGIYLSTRFIGEIDIEKFRPMPLKKCPDVKITNCFDYGDPEKWQDVLRNGGGRYRFVGAVGKDIIIVSKDGISVYPEMAHPGDFVFRTYKYQYLMSNHEYFRVVNKIPYEPKDYRFSSSEGKFEKVTVEEIHADRL